MLYFLFLLTLLRYQPSHGCYLEILMISWVYVYCIWCISCDDIHNRSIKHYLTFYFQYFRSSCTHVICGHLSRSEKYLGACATGKWILHPDYITDSVENKKWLSEEDYEWSRFTCSPNVSLQLRDSPGRWRRMIQSTQLSAFSGWKVAVVVGSGKSVVYKRWPIQWEILIVVVKLSLIISCLIVVCISVLHF